MNYKLLILQIKLIEQSSFVFEYKKLKGEIK